MAGGGGNQMWCAKKGRGGRLIGCAVRRDHGRAVEHESLVAGQKAQRKRREAVRAREGGQ